MKAIFKTISAMLVVMLVLAAFPISAGASACNQAQFIRDVTVRDGSQKAPGEEFTKTWLLKNTGTCTWTAGTYKLVLETGSDAFGVATSHTLPANVLPYATVELTIPGMIAPASPGKHRSSWRLEDGAGNKFGVGWSGYSVAIFTEINVVTPPTVTYDFTAQAPSALWRSSVPGGISFPGTPGAAIGSVIEQAAPKFESGVTASTPGLVVSPNNDYNGFIEGNFTAYTVKKGDRFQTTVGCEYGQTSCYVAFSLKYQIGSGPIYTLWTFRERYEGLTYSANLNLDRLAGKTVNFILSMSAYGSPVGDSAIWGHPVIVGTGTPVDPSVGWSAYSNSTVPFSFKFPPGSKVVPASNQITLPFAAGTNLSTKYLEISTSAAGAGDCLSSKTSSDPPVSVTFNGIEFMKQTDVDSVGAGAGVHEWVAYSAKDPSDGTCVSLTFTLSYPAPPDLPTFNKAAEMAIYDTLMSTFAWEE